MVSNANSGGRNSGGGISGMAKEGPRNLSGSDAAAATLRNIEAARSLSSIVSSSLGPNGMKKLVVINHLEKVILTSDCATIVKEMDIEHPAAKMLQLAAEMQDKECGDGTNLTVSFAGELLSMTEDLLRMGLHASEIIGGYKRAAEKVLETLPSLSVAGKRIGNCRDKKELVRAIRPVVAAKLYGSEDILAPLVADACLGTMNYAGPPVIHVDSVRIAKVLGGRLSQSQVIHGFVQMRGVETTLQSVVDARITVFGCGIELLGPTDTNAAMDNADHINNNKAEAKMEDIIKTIADTGTRVVVTSGNVSEIALHFIERFDIMCVKISSKSDLRRLCSAVNATALARLGAATADEMGFCDFVSVREVGTQKITVFSQNKSVKDGCRLSTILLTASTDTMLQDAERSIVDAVHAAKTACKDGRLVPGAGATEMELSHRIKKYGDTCPGLDQYAVRAFAKALEFVPRTLADNAALDSEEVVAALEVAHADGQVAAGVNINAASSLGMNESKNGTGGDGGVIRDAGDVLDLLSTKMGAFRLAIDAALTVLRVDQIIMNKPTGTPKSQQ